MDESALERYFDKYIANVDKVLPDQILTPNLDDITTQQNAKSESRAGSAGSSTPEDRTCPKITAPVIHQPQIVLQISNIISTVKLGCTLDLHFIARNTWNVEYNPKAYKALIMRIREPRITATIYRSGNVVFSGARSEEQSRRGGRKCARKLQKLGIPVRFLNFKIQNLHATCSTFPIRLEQLALHPLCSYEPELFPGVFYTGGPDGVCTIIFASGNISFSGALREAEIYKALDSILPILSCCRRPEGALTGTPAH